MQEALGGHEIIRRRIGRHIGGVTFEEENIFGDGINIAARLQEIASPGAIDISDMAWRAIVRWKACSQIY